MLNYLEIACFNFPFAIGPNLGVMLISDTRLIGIKQIFKSQSHVFSLLPKMGKRRRRDSGASPPFGPWQWKLLGSIGKSGLDSVMGKQSLIKVQA